MLADMGADVIKIEDPGTGDLARNMMPKKDGISTYFVMFNRGQRGVTLNLKSEEGKEILRKMILSADVLIENFRPSVDAAPRLFLRRGGKAQPAHHLRLHLRLQGRKASTPTVRCSTPWHRP